MQLLRHLAAPSSDFAAPEKTRFREFLPAKFLGSGSISNRPTTRFCGMGDPSKGISAAASLAYKVPHSAYVQIVSVRINSSGSQMKKMLNGNAYVRISRAGIGCKLDNHWRLSDILQRWNAGISFDSFLIIQQLCAKGRKIQRIFRCDEHRADQRWRTAQVVPVDGELLMVRLSPCMVNEGERTA
jgi:hypothetical protein